MEWKIKIDSVLNQRVRVLFNPMTETIHFYGEYKPKNREWIVFSEYTNNMKMELSDVQEIITKTIELMRTRLNEYKNISGGFEVIKEVKYLDD
jgi:hypothetical protein